MAMRIEPSPWSCRSSDSDVVLQEGRDVAAHVGAIQRERQVGLEEPDRVAAVQALALEQVAVERLQPELAGQRIGQLDLATCPLPHPSQTLETLPRRTVPAAPRPCQCTHRALRPSTNAAKP